MKPKSARVTKIPFSLYDAEIRIVVRLSKMRRLYNRSLALRQIIHEWDAAQVKAAIETIEREAGQ